jgi:hypothetical protein
MPIVLYVIFVFPNKVKELLYIVYVLDKYNTDATNIIRGFVNN